jgi:hypothetical protein
LVSKRNEQCDEANNWSVQQQSRHPPSFLVDEAMEGVAEPEQVILEEFWQVFKNLVKDLMDTFLRLFVPESKVKWGIINEKALLVMKALLTAKLVEATIQGHFK